jgi:carbohydrate diacid regulator
MGKMLLNSDFLDHIIAKYTSKDIVIHITDEKSQIVASTDSNRLSTKSSTAQYILQVMRPTAMENPGRQNFENISPAGDFIAYGTPIYSNKELSGTVIIHGSAGSAAQTGEMIRASIESALEYAGYSGSINPSADPRVPIAQMLLSDKPDEEKLIPMMNRQELDPSLLRTVICVSLTFHQTSYFNINLSLGYQSGIERIRAEAVKRLKANRYFNSQDLICLYSNNVIAVIKSFFPVEDNSRIYLSLDKICRDLADSLEEFSAFSFGIAYGNLSYGVKGLKKSLNEAMDIITIGRRTRPEERIFILEYILFDNVCHYLYPQIINKLIEPAIANLKKKDGSIPAELIACVEAFVDNCMNFAQTSNKTGSHRNTISSRLEKLKLLTGLDPANSFRDAFVVKMLATYIRQNNIMAPLE